MRILITAFEPFGGAETNITQSVLSLLPDSVADWAIEKVCLPVSFKRAPIVLREAIATYSPDLVIMLGQCSTGENIRLERFAINMMDSSKADNDGYIPNEETIYNLQPLALQTPLSVKALAISCAETGLPVVVSNSAGLYCLQSCVLRGVASAATSHLCACSQEYRRDDSPKCAGASFAKNNGLRLSIFFDVL